MNDIPREHLRLELIEGIAIVHFLDRELTEPYDSYDACEVGDQLASLVEDGGYTRLVLDFRDVEWVSSYILGRLVCLKKKVEKTGGQVVLCGMEFHLVREIFRITGLDRIFAIEADEQAALDVFERQGHRRGPRLLGFFPLGRSRSRSLFRR